MVTESLFVELDARPQSSRTFDYMAKENAVRWRIGNKFCANEWGPSGWSELNRLVGYIYNKLWF